MKKFTKTALILAAVFLTLGLGFCFAGAAMGAGLEDLNVEISQFPGEIGVHLENAGIFLTRQMSNHHEEEYEENRVGHEAENAHRETLLSVQYQGDRKEYEIPSSQIDSIRMDFHGEDIFFEKSTGDTIQISIENDKKNRIEVLTENSTLLMKEQDSGVSISVSTPTVRIRFPETCSLEKWELKLGAGEAKLKTPLSAKTIKVELGAGEIEALESIRCEESSWNVGAGELTIKSLTSSETVLECGVGDIEVTLAQSQKDYNYQVNCGIGAVEIGRDTYSGLAKTATVDNHAENNLKISCGVGEVEVDFEQR